MTITKKHAADHEEIGFLTKSISNTYGQATAMPPAWELNLTEIFEIIFLGFGIAFLEIKKRCGYEEVDCVFWIFFIVFHDFGQKTLRWVGRKNCVLKISLETKAFLRVAVLVEKYFFVK